ncbi:arginine ABC transporter ATP-binding protein ArtP [Parasalinivibrio latis]|uniref:arginine ABC transporter ATP-binding protein ArtP n=1 Tax=Parasalinivibrio latis TaxID=2952610 RepID=UPI0030E33212
MKIELAGIDCFYGQNQSLFDISFKCKQGETLVLLGPSGAGKSSLLRVLNLLEVPRNGLLSLAGEQFDLSQKPDDKKIRELRTRVGMVFQQYNLWPHLTVMGNLTEAPMKVHKIAKQEANDKAQKLVERLHLTGLEKRYPLQLSGGQQQRVAIARALMMEPDILLFDEPTAALDPEITTQFVNIVKELSETGITQVIVTHEVDVAKRIASQVIYLEQGRIVESGSAERFAQPQTAEFSAYLSH